MAYLLSLKTFAQTIPLRSFLELKTATWAGPSMRGVVGMNEFLASDKNNIGVQIHLSNSKLGLPSSVIDSWGNMSTGLYNYPYIPVWSCRRDDKVM